METHPISHPAQQPTAATRPLTRSTTPTHQSISNTHQLLLNLLTIDFSPLQLHLYRPQTPSSKCLAATAPSGMTSSSTARPLVLSSPMSSSPVMAAAPARGALLALRDRLATLEALLPARYVFSRSRLPLGTHLHPHRRSKPGQRPCQHST